MSKVPPGPSVKQVMPQPSLLNTAEEGGNGPSAEQHLSLRNPEDDVEGGEASSNDSSGSEESKQAKMPLTQKGKKTKKSQGGRQTGRLVGVADNSVDGIGAPPGSSSPNPRSTMHGGSTKTVELQKNNGLSLSASALLGALPGLPTYKDLQHGFYKFPYKEGYMEGDPNNPVSYDFVPGSKPMQAKPFVFISSAHLQSDHFDIVKVFQALSAPVDNKLKDLTPQVKVPSIIFRLNSANDSNTWNVRLPNSRMNLAACQFNIEKPNDELFVANVGVQEIEEGDEDDDQAAGGESQEATGADADGRNGFKLTRRGSMMENSKAHLHLERSAQGVQGRKPKKEADLDEEILKRRRLLNHGKPVAREPPSANVKHLQASRSSLGHYYSVLREKCKRLLKGTYAACEQAGAMFRIDDNWSEDYPNDYVTEWLTDGYRDENIKLIGVGDIKNLHPLLQGGILDYAKVFKSEGEEEHQTEEYPLPQAVLEGFTSVAAIDAKIAELKELRAWRLALSVAALQDASGGCPEGESLSRMSQKNMSISWDNAPAANKSTLTQKALDDALFHVRSCQKHMADLILRYIKFLFNPDSPGMDARVADLLVTERQHFSEVREARDISAELGTLLEKLDAILPRYADKNSPKDMKTLKELPSQKLKEPPLHPLFAFLDELFHVDGMDPSLEAVDYIVTQYMKVRAFFAMPMGSDGRKKLSFPHRALTHLILTDDIDLLELKFTEIVPWGAIIINGGDAAADIVVDCVQRGRPLVSVKYTGGTADLVVGMLEKKNFYLKAKKIDPEFDMPVPNEVAYYVKMPDEGWQQDDWLKAFDRPHTRTAFKMNALLENWPDRFSEASVFVVDTFLTTEDDVQDRITQTMGVVFESAHELGGSISEQKRLTYAWRVRHKFLFNANLYKFISDLLYLLITLLTMFCTMSAVIYSYIQIYPDQLTSSMYANTEVYLAALNLVLPLVTTIVRGIYASVSPLLKYVALKNACVQVEGEIYMYR